MKVLEAIKDNGHFVITNKGNILAINNGDKISFHSKRSENEILNMDVLKVQNVEGLYVDYNCIRV